MSAPSRRTLVLDAATTVIARDGLRAVTHRAVAAQAGTSVRAITYHFDSIEALIEATFLHYVERALERFSHVRDSLPPVPSAAEAARALAWTVAGDVLSDRDGLTVEYALVLEMARRPTLVPAWNRWQQSLLDILTHFATVLGSPCPRDHARVVLATLRGLELEALATPDACLDEDALEHLFGLLLRGLMTDPAGDDNATLP